MTVLRRNGPDVILTAASGRSVRVKHGEFYDFPEAESAGRLQSGHWLPEIPVQPIVVGESDEEKTIKKPRGSKTEVDA